MNLKHTLRELLRFSKKERLGAICLLLFILIVIFLPFAKPGPPLPEHNTDWLAAAEQLRPGDKKEQLPTGETGEPERMEGYPEASANNAPGIPQSRFFPFDPNTLDANGFKKLGLRPKTIQTLFTYRTKGG